MKNLLKLVLLSGAFVALAQDRTITVRTLDVDVNGVEILILPDAGCSLRPLYEVTALDVRPRVKTYPFNGPRCASIAAAAERAAWLDVGVSDGGRP